MHFLVFFDEIFMPGKLYYVSTILGSLPFIYLNLFNKLLTAYAHSRMILNVDGSR